MFLVFVCQKKGSVCAGGRARCSVGPNVHNFTIHGLWPSRWEGPLGPFNCRDTPFDFDGLGPLVDRMRIEWADYLGDERGFWKHEWCTLFVALIFACSHRTHSLT